MSPAKRLDDGSAGEGIASESRSGAARAANGSARGADAPSPAEKSLVGGGSAEGRPSPAEMTRLTMSPATFDELCARTDMARTDDGPTALRHALRWHSTAADGQVTVQCPPAALRFIQSEAPELAARWPEMFGHLGASGPALPSDVLDAFGQIVAGIEAGGSERLRLTFVSGDALVVGADGSIAWWPR